jgi:hypothetical protein
MSKMPKVAETGANPTIAIYNDSVVNFYNAMGSLARFEIKNIIFYLLLKTLYPPTTLALYLAVNSKVVGLAPAWHETKSHICSDSVTSVISGELKGFGNNNKQANKQINKQTNKQKRLDLLRLVQRCLDDRQLLRFVVVVVSQVEEHLDLGKN